MEKFNRLATASPLTSRTGSSLKAQSLLHFAAKKTEWGWAGSRLELIASWHQRRWSIVDFSTQLDPVIFCSYNVEKQTSFL